MNKIKSAVQVIVGISLALGAISLLLFILAGLLMAIWNVVILAILPVMVLSFWKAVLLVTLVWVTLIIFYAINDVVRDWRTKYAIYSMEKLLRKMNGDNAESEQPDIGRHFRFPK